MLESTLYWQHGHPPLGTGPAWPFMPPPVCKTAYPMVGLPSKSNHLGLMSSDGLMSDLFDEDDAQVKRPMNSFLLWAKIMRKKFAKDYPNLHNAEISKLLGKVWNGMSTSEKRPFVEKAEKLRVLHMRDHPNYRYAPKKKKEKRAAQRMIPPEVAAAFHNALFDLKGAKEGPGAAIFGKGRNGAGTDDILQDNAPFSVMLKSDYDRTSPKLADYKESDEGMDMLNVSQRCSPSCYRGAERGHGTSDGQSTPDLVRSRVELPRSSTLSMGACIKGIKSANAYRFPSYTSSFPLTKLVHRHEFSTENLDQVTPSSPQEHGESLGYLMNEENFYPPMESLPGPLATCVVPGQDCDTLTGSERAGSTPGSPESGYDDEVPPFLRALLEKPIHLEQPKMQQVIEREDDIILHDLGEIISKELGQDRKACLYS